MSREFAVVTGASTGIGLELARCAAAAGCDLLLAADEPEVQDVAAKLRTGDGEVRAITCDLATAHGVAALFDAIEGRRLDIFAANAGRGLGHAFLEQDWDEIEEVIHTNVTGTTAALHRAVHLMKPQGAGRILITGSIAGYMPGSFQAVYNATKAYLDTLSWGIRDELRDSGVTVTCLMPGPTETEFFERAHMEDTPVGQDDKADPAKVARAGWRAMRRGASGVTPGFMNKLQKTMAGILPEEVLARMHREMAEPEGNSHG
ncbi:SDR family NAD(P)-dependent oxidoreductase [Wenxinia marina]|uniref:Wenxma_16, whole genome shotgun sequence n=1 Tax=Wenxinia marina DSM 24838 TaxID=1123501 RepID=A0A0D0NID2_9RHOB|nr:SDR family NAD(P)-dependent oxidoreductase [Wenxinia marina]KIQ68090.1 Short-chain dehydrogenase [Wenxinia marina DSM 24838]GGL78140.1 oxidoreductase [Wenxinia marina]